MAKEAYRTQELITLKETEVRPKKIKQTDASTVARKKRPKEILNFLDDLISKIVSTFEQTQQSEEQATNTKYLITELNKSSEILKRLNDIDIVEFLNENRSVNFQTCEETILDDSLAIGEKVEDCVQNVMENILKNEKNVCRKSGQPFSKLNVSTNKTEMSFINADGKVFGEEIVKEMKLLQHVEQLVKNLIKNVQDSLKTKANVLYDSLQQLNVSNDYLQKSSVSTDCLQKQDVPTNCLQQPSMSNYCLQQPNVSNDCLQRWNLSNDCLQQPHESMDCLQQPHVSTDCLQQPHVSTNCLQQPIVMTDSLQPRNKSIDCLIQPSTQTDSFQKSSPPSNSLQQENALVRSLEEIISMDDYLKETVEKAYQILEHESNKSTKLRRAASLITRIFEGSLQLHERGLYVLQEIQNMIDIVDCVEELNEYFQIDIRNIFLEQREINRISIYVYERIAAVTRHCQIQKLIDYDAVDALKTWMAILKDVRLVKSQIRKLFKKFLLIQRSFLIHSLKFTSIPYEMLIGDRRYTSFITMVKSSVIRMCGSIFGIEELDDIHESVLAGYKNIVRHIECTE